MQYTGNYDSPLGKVLLAADEKGLTGLWFEGQKYYGFPAGTEYEEKELPIFEETAKWLDVYFSGKDPGFELPIHFIGSEFQKQVWEILYSIPYGKITTYGEIAKMIAKKRGVPSMSAQAVGGAVGHNKISVIVPCHRVVGSDGSLTGYAGGIDKKAELLRLEGVDIKNAGMNRI